MGSAELGARPAAVPGTGMSVATVVAMGSCVAILEGYDIQAIGVAAPSMGLMQGFAPDAKGWVFSASMIGLVLGAMIGGWLADRIGRKPILLSSVVAFGVFSLATIWADGWWTLFLARIATGLGLGGAVPTLISVAGEAARRNRRTIATTAMFAGMPAGGTISALVVQYLVPLSDWRIIFVIGGALPLAVAPVIWALMPNLPPPEPDRQAARPSTLAALFGRERAVATLLLWTAFVLTLIVLYLLLNWLPLLAEAKGIAKTEAGVPSIAYNLGSIPGAILLGGLVDRWGVRPVMLASFGGAVLTMAGFAATSDFAAIIILSALAGWFVVGSLYVLYATTPAYYPRSVRNTGTGAAVGVGRFGSIVSPLIAGFLLRGGFSASEVMLLMAPVMLVGGAAIVALTFLGRPYRD